MSVGDQETAEADDQEETDFATDIASDAVHANTEAMKAAFATDEEAVDEEGDDTAENSIQVEADEVEADEAEEEDEEEEVAPQEEDEDEAAIDTAMSAASSDNDD